MAIDEEMQKSVEWVGALVIGGQHVTSGGVAALGEVDECSKGKD